MADSFKEAATASDGKQYFVPKDYYPWAVFYKKSLEKNGSEPPTTLDDLNSLMKQDAGDDAGAVRLRGQGRGGPRWAPSTSRTCGSTASTTT